MLPCFTLMLLQFHCLLLYAVKYNQGNWGLCDPLMGNIAVAVKAKQRVTQSRLQGSELETSLQVFCFSDLLGPLLQP